MKQSLKYILLFIAFFILISVSDIAIPLFEGTPVHSASLLFLLPTALLITISAALNDRILIPNMLLKGADVKYSLTLAFITICTLAASVLYQSLILHFFDADSANTPMPATEEVFLQLSNFCTLFLILLGIGMVRLIRSWHKDLKDEKRISGQLEDYINKANASLHTKTLILDLEKIANALKACPLQASQMIVHFSSWLHNQLATIPAPPQVEVGSSTVYHNTLLQRFLTVKKLRPARNLSLIIFIYGLIFINYLHHREMIEPGESIATLTFSLGTGIILLCYFNLLTYKILVYREGYFTALYIAIIVLLSMSLTWMGLSAGADTSGSPHANLFFFIVMLAVGTIIITFLFGALTGVMFLQDWLRTKHNMTMLHAATMRQEYNYLRKQINPHFLFNILNGISVLSKRDPELAHSYAVHLTELLRYQTEDFCNHITTLGREIAWIRSFFSLERMVMNRWTMW